ncbi:MAG: hypothetical protein AAFR83_25350, partial [Cyanobacteria bacterium J06629_18]
KVSRACARLRPATRPSSIGWSLSKVLELASGMENNTLDLKSLTQKTIFLLAMASGARLSELASLVRDPGHISFENSGEVLLVPHPTFLAKNESPEDRWGPWKIISLPETPSLCPVQCLKDYLEATPQWKEGGLFRALTGSALTPKEIKGRMGIFVRRADPDSHFKGHDPRKVAASLNFFRHMSFSDLKSYTGWKSPGVFFKHYAKEIEEIGHSVVAMGKIVRPTVK